MSADPLTYLIVSALAKVLEPPACAVCHATTAPVAFPTLPGKHFCRDCGDKLLKRARWIERQRSRPWWARWFRRSR